MPETKTDADLRSSDNANVLEAGAKENLATFAKASDLGEKILLEDYKMWQRELEKQDRWMPQSLWTVLAGVAAGLVLVRQLERADRVAVAVALVVVAGVFISMSA